MATKHRHHYLSRFYLGGFTPSGRRDDLLFVTSKSQTRQWRAQAEQVCHQRDLFRPEGNNFDPDEFEDAFATVENEIAPVLRDVQSQQLLPRNYRKRALLLYLPALNAARPPAEIQALADYLDLEMRRQIVDALTPEQHRDLLNDWAKAGRDPSIVRDLEIVKKRIMAGSIKIRADNDTMLLAMLRRATYLVDMLQLRRWNLLIADADELGFICSDRPVPLLNNTNLPAGTSPRFDDPRFDVVMPLSRKLCLVGRPTGHQVVGKASDLTVRFINRMIEAGARDYIFSATSQYAVSSSVSDTSDETDAYRSDLWF